MSSRPRILLIDESAEDRALAGLVLTTEFPGAILDEAGAGDDFVEALDHGFYDLVVTELDTAWAQGAFLLQAIRARQPRAAIVVFTASDDRQTAVEALKVGAEDYVIKSSGGFLDLRRAAADALPELTFESVSPAAPAPEPESRSAFAETLRSALLESYRGNDPVAVDPKSETEPRQPEIELPEVPPPGGGAPSATVSEPQLPAEEAEEPLPSTPAPESRSDVEPPSALGPMTDAAPDRPVISTSARAEPFRGAVESARQSISAVSHRPLGAVLGIIAILAAFIILYATFFGGDSDSVEAGAPNPAVATSPIVDSAPVASEPSPVVESPPGAARDALEDPAASGSTGSANRGPGPSAPVPSSSLSPSAAPLVLELEAVDQVWIQLTIDGEPVIDAVLATGQSYTFEGRETAALLIGNASGLRVVWNGEDLGSLGRDGQVRRLYFTPTELGVGAPPGGSASS